MVVLQEFVPISIEVFLLHVFTWSWLHKCMITRIVEWAFLLPKWNLVYFERGQPFLLSYLLMQQLLRSQLPGPNPSSFVILGFSIFSGFEGLFFNFISSRSKLYVPGPISLVGLRFLCRNLGTFDAKKLDFYGFYCLILISTELTDANLCCTAAYSWLNAFLLGSCESETLLSTLFGTRLLKAAKAPDPFICYYWQQHPGPKCPFCQSLQSKRVSLAQEYLGALLGE